MGPCRNTWTYHRSGTIVLMRAFDPSAVFPTIEKEKVTTGLAVPAMLDSMLQVGNHDDGNRPDATAISGGEDVYPAEVENALMGHPDVADVAVIGMPSEKWGESAAAIVVPRQGADLRADDVRDTCQGKLARFKQPRVVEFIDEIPRNPTGKILKRILREQFPGPAPE